MIFCFHKIVVFVWIMMIADIKKEFLVLLFWPLENNPEIIVCPVFLLLPSQVHLESCWSVTPPDSPDIFTSERSQRCVTEITAGQSGSKSNEIVCQGFMP